jgi:very-short-patch-repair endonuclease
VPAPRPIPRELLGRPFRREDARRAGVTPSQLRGQRFNSPFYNVHTVGGLPDLLSRCAAAGLVLPDDALFSDHTAGALLDLPVPRDPRLHVTRPTPGSLIRRRGMAGHVRHVSSEEIWTLGTIAFTSPARTFFDLAETVGRPALVAFADALLRSRLDDPGSLLRKIADRTGRRGTETARLALMSADPRAESPMESQLRILLIDGGLPAFDVNVDLRDSNGLFIARADLYLEQARVLAEYDGDQHRTDPVQFARDVRRRAALAAAGFIQLRFTASDVLRNPASVVDLVATTLRRRGVRW